MDTRQWLRDVRFAAARSYPFCDPKATGADYARAIKVAVERAIAGSASKDPERVDGAAVSLGAAGEALARLSRGGGEAAGVLAEGGAVQRLQGGYLGDRHLVGLASLAGERLSGARDVARVEGLRGLAVALVSCSLSIVAHGVLRAWERPPKRATKPAPEVAQKGLFDE